MTALKPPQVRRLTRLMDARYARELEEIEAITARSRRERSEEALAGRPAEQLDATLAALASASDDAMVRQNVEDVRDILGARRRLAAGRYGICIDCDEDIPYERLLAYPTAKRCIACQRLHEDGLAGGSVRRTAAG